MTKDEGASTELKEPFGEERPAILTHYLYFGSRRAAERIGRTLGGAGFSVETRLGGDQVNWLVLARHRLVTTETVLTQTRASLEALARSAGGEYDGWEAELVP